MFYKINMAALQLRELWRLTPWIALPVVLVWKLLGRTTGTLQYGYWFDDNVVRIDWKKMAPMARHALQEFVAVAEKLGARFMFCYQTVSVGDTEGYAVALLHPDATAWVGATWVRAVHRVESVHFVSTTFQDGAVLSTSSGRKRLDTPAGITVIRLPGASVEELFARHRQELATCSDRQPVILDENGLVALIAQTRRLLAENFIQRGVWVPMTDDEVVELERKWPR
jgi:hypothetical protein